MVIEYKEPLINYTVTGTQADGKPLIVEFNSAIDAKEYRLVGISCASKASITCVNHSATKGVTTSADEKTIQTYTVTVLKDGKKFEGKGTVKGPNGGFKNYAFYGIQ